MQATFPDFWWNEERPLVFGHRGALRQAPENTLAAFRQAVTLGADGVELDVHLSADGVPMVIHNAKVDATTDGSGYVSAMSREQLQALDAGSHFDAAFAGEHIPTLQEVLAEVGHDLLFNIELKDPVGRSMDIELAVVNVVRRMGMEERVWFSSFKPYILHQLKQFAPRIPRGLLYSPLHLPTLLLAPVTPHEAIHPYDALVTRRLVRRAHRRQRRVSVWTVDNAERARGLARIGVDVIITNVPDEILAALATPDAA